MKKYKDMSIEELRQERDGLNRHKNRLGMIGLLVHVSILLSELAVIIFFRSSLIVRLYSLTMILNSACYLLGSLIIGIKRDKVKELIHARNLEAKA